MSALFVGLQSLQLLKDIFRYVLLWLPAPHRELRLTCVRVTFSPLYEVTYGINLWRCNIDDLLRLAMESKASDLHLKVGNHPYLRVDGVLIPLTDVPRITPKKCSPWPSA